MLAELAEGKLVALLAQEQQEAEALSEGSPGKPSIKDEVGP